MQITHSFLTLLLIVPSLTYGAAGSAQTIAKLITTTRSNRKERHEQYSMFATHRIPKALRNAAEAMPAYIKYTPPCLPNLQPFVVEHLIKHDDQWYAVISIGFTHTQKIKKLLELRRYVERRQGALARHLPYGDFIDITTTSQAYFKFPWQLTTYVMPYDGTKFDTRNLVTSDSTKSARCMATINPNPKKLKPGPPVILDIPSYLSATKERLLEHLAACPKSMRDCFSRTTVSMPGNKLYYAVIYSAKKAEAQDRMIRKEVNLILLATSAQETTAQLATTLVQKMSEPSECYMGLTKSVVQQATASQSGSKIRYACAAYMDLADGNRSLEEEPYDLILIQDTLDTALQLESYWKTDLQARAAALAAFAQAYDIHGPHHEAPVLVPNSIMLEHYLARTDSADELFVEYIPEP
jgi:hypothetical protein